MKKNTSWFSIIEILIWIFIFTLGLVSIYALILTTMKLNDYSKNSIIASNLAREWIEIVRNIRDSNYKNIHKWNKLPGNDMTATFQKWVYYKVENNLNNTSGESIIFQKIDNFSQWKSELQGKMKDYQLCLNSNNIYTHNCLTTHTPTYFYRYITFSEVKYDDGGIEVILPDAIKLTSKVIWYHGGYHEVQLDTILTDFLRQ